MTIGAIIWLVLKWLLLIAAGSSLLLALIALFHPLRFDLNLRGSLRGQRAELWFVYLFRILKIGIVATPHTQDVVIKVLFWQKLLQRNQRQRPKPASPQESESASTFSPPTSQETKDEPGPEKETDAGPTVQKEAAKDAKKKHDAEEIEAKTEAVPSKETVTTKQAVETSAEADSQSSEISADEKAFPPNQISAEDEKTTDIIEEPGEKDGLQLESAPEKITPRESLKAEKTEITDVVPEPDESIDKIDPFAGQEKQAASEGEDIEGKSSTNDTWARRFKLLRRRISEKYAQGKKWLRLIGRKYRLLSPVFWKFYGRSKKGFRIDQPRVLCRYALHEPYLTGMFQGNLAVFSGLLQRFGVEFIPVPVFTAPTIYAKAQAGLILLPYRFIFATIGLLCERILWTEAWRLYKWYRARKTAASE